MQQLRKTKSFEGLGGTGTSAFSHHHGGSHHRQEPLIGGMNQNQQSSASQASSSNQFVSTGSIASDDRSSGGFSGLEQSYKRPVNYKRGRFQPNLLHPIYEEAANEDLLLRNTMTIYSPKDVEYLRFITDSELELLKDQCLEHILMNHTVVANQNPHQQLAGGVEASSGQKNLQNIQQQQFKQKSLNQKVSDDAKYIINLNPESAQLSTSDQKNKNLAANTNEKHFHQEFNINEFKYGLEGSQSSLKSIEQLLRDRIDKIDTIEHKKFKDHQKELGVSQETLKERSISTRQHQNIAQPGDYQQETIIEKAEHMFEDLASSMKHLVISDNDDQQELNKDDFLEEQPQRIETHREVDAQLQEQIGNKLNLKECWLKIEMIERFKAKAQEYILTKHILNMIELNKREQLDFQEDRIKNLQHQCSNLVNEGFEDIKALFQSFDQMLSLCLESLETMKLLKQNIQDNEHENKEYLLEICERIEQNINKHELELIEIKDFIENRGNAPDLDKPKDQLEVDKIEQAFHINERLRLLDDQFDDIPSQYLQDQAIQDQILTLNQSKFSLLQKEQQVVDYKQTIRDQQFQIQQIQEQIRQAQDKARDLDEELKDNKDLERLLGDETKRLSKKGKSSKKKIKNKIQDSQKRQIFDAQGNQYNDQNIELLQSNVQQQENLDQDLVDLDSQIANQREMKKELEQRKREINQNNRNHDYILQILIGFSLLAMIFTIISKIDTRIEVPYITQISNIIFEKLWIFGDSTKHMHIHDA
eukprot:403334983